MSILNRPIPASEPAEPTIGPRDTTSPDAPALHPPRIADAPMTATEARRRFKADGVRLFAEMAALGDVVYLPLRPPSVIVNHPIDLRHVLARNALNYHKAGFEVAFRTVLGSSLINLEGEEHRSLRKAMQPGFAHRAMTGHAAIVDRHVRSMIHGLRDGEPFNLAAGMMRCMANVSAEAMLGLTDRAAIGALFDGIRTAHRAHVLRQGCPYAAVRRFVGPAGRRTRRAKALLDGVILEHIDRRRRLLSAGSGTRPRRVALDTLIELADASPADWPATRLRDNALNLFLAAYEPAANTATWTLHYLTRDPHLMRLAEQDAAGLAERIEDAGYDPLDAMPYIRMCFNESMRIRPATWLMTRRAVADDVLPSGGRVRRGMQVYLSPYTVHRRTDLYPEPERFDPQRFCERERKRRDPYGYIPFGGGPRICLGEHMARHTGVMAVGRVLRSLRLEPVAAEAGRFESLNSFTIQPVDGVLNMVARHRDR